MTATTGWENILGEGEKIIWQGQPDSGFHLRFLNVLISGFGVFFLLFAIFWMVLAASASMVFMLAGAPFVLIGLYMIFGIHFFDMKRRQNTHYTLTSNHAFIATNLLGKRLRSYPITKDTQLDYRAGPLASIFFAKKLVKGDQGSHVQSIGFEMLLDGDNVHGLFQQVQRGQN